MMWHVRKKVSIRNKKCLWIHFCSPLANVCIGDLGTNIMSNHLNARWPCPGVLQHFVLIRNPKQIHASYIHWHRQLHVMLPICAVQKSHKQGQYDSDVKGSSFETLEKHPVLQANQHLRLCEVAPSFANNFFCSASDISTGFSWRSYVIQASCNKIWYDYRYFMSHIGSQKPPQRPWLYPWIQHLTTKWLRRLESVSKKMCCVHNLHRWWNIFFLHWWTNLRLLWLQKMEPYSADNFFHLTNSHPLALRSPRTPGSS